MIQSTTARLLEKAFQIEEFGKADINKLSQCSDKELAIWQCEYKIESPQWLWAEQQWKLRLMAHQTRLAAQHGYRAALLGAALGGLMAALGGAVVAWLSH